MVIGTFRSDTVFLQLNQYSQILRRQCCLPPTCPRKREEEGESPDDGKSPVAWAINKTFRATTNCRCLGWTTTKMIITVADNPFIQMEIVNRNDDQKCCPSKLDIATISELSSYTQWCRNHLEWFGKVSNFKSFKYQVNFRLRELIELIKYLFLFMYFCVFMHLCLI